MRRTGRGAVGRTPGAALGVALATLALLAGAPGAGAADLEDLLWDLQVVPLDREPAPGFTLEALEGERVSLASLRGRAVVLYFWMTT